MQQQRLDFFVASLDQPLPSTSVLRQLLDESRHLYAKPGIVDVNRQDQTR
jgi:hypothetical protein